MNSEERVLQVLQRKQPDRVPHFEWLVDRKVREGLFSDCPGEHDFAVRMGQDAVIVDLIYQKEQIGPNRWLSEWGYVSQKTEEEHAIEVESPIETMADFERFSPPDPLAPGRYEAVETTVKRFAGDKAVICHLNDVLSLPRYLMGMENLLLAVALDPELVRALVDLSVEYNLIAAKEVVKRGVKIVYTGDDFAY
ncbi:MAG TPA: uroporphyrinogen decarboxylase family protein, partial [Anaerolineales bacterium]|nr:uroporphyrinogen decarboxylase family protein [Anaerolineales bacterium]